MFITILVDGYSVLIENGANVNSKDRDGWTPLHFAAWKDSEEAAKLLLNAKAEVDLEDGIGRPPLHFAAWYGSPKVAKLLLRSGANVSGEHYDWTPLHYAGKDNHYLIIGLSRVFEVTGSIEQERREAQEDAINGGVSCSRQIRG